MSIQEAQEKINYAEFKYWKAFDRISPVGDERFDYLFASLSSLLANINLPKGKTQFKIKDFLLQWGSGSSGQSQKEMETLLFSFAKAHNNKLGKK